MALGALAALAGAFAGTWATPASASGADHCHKLYRLTDVSHAVEPGIPVPATGALPAHCRVRGVINRAIRFEVTLPEDWNGRLMLFAVHELQAAHPLTKEAFLVLDEASRTACDAMDGVEDGVINDPRICETDVDALVCGEGQTAGCLTAGQAETARFIYSDMVDADGNVLSPGVPPGAESQGDWGSWLLGGEVVPGGLGKMLRDNLAKHMRHDPTFDAAQFDPARDHARIGDALASYDSTADLKEFRARGGKILMYQGWNDFPLRAGRAFDYLAAVEAAAGGPEQAAEFFRLFMVPGMLHCSGGPGPWQADYVDPIVQWTEQGIAPERIVASHPGEAIALPHLNPSRPPEPSRAFTRPLCVYPKLGLYRGEGDPDDESSFRRAVP